VVFVVGLWLNPGQTLAGAEPALFALMAASGIYYGRQQVMAFGMVPARADIIAWIFCGIWILGALLQRDYVRVVSNLCAGLSAFPLLRTRLPRVRLSGRWARLRLWWLRRRYKVIDGGKSKEKRWMN
jgi:hypothetical protein